MDDEKKLKKELTQPKDRATILMDQVINRAFEVGYGSINVKFEVRKGKIHKAWVTGKEQLLPPIETT